MKKLQNLFLVLLSGAIGLLAAVVLCEACFYITHGDFFYKKSLHYKLAKGADYRFEVKAKDTKFEKQLEELPQQNLLQLAVNGAPKEGIALSNTEGIDYSEYSLLSGCWVLADKPENVRLELAISGDKVYSPYHSGSGRWEYLCVNSPLIADNCEAAITSKGSPFYYAKQPILLRPLRLAPENDRTLLKYKVNYKKSGKVRIVFIGGSTTYGVFIPPSEGGDYPFILQQMFDSLYPGKVDVINYGISAANVEDFWSVHKEYILALEPDIIVVAPVWNDSHNFLNDLFCSRHTFLNYNDINLFFERGLGNRFAMGYYLKRVFIKLFNFEINMLREKKLSRMFNERRAQTHRILADNFLSEEKASFNEDFFNRLDKFIKFYKDNDVLVFLANLPYYRVDGRQLSKQDVDGYLAENKRLRAHSRFPVEDLNQDPNVFLATLELLDCLYASDREVMSKVASENKVSFLDIAQDQAFKLIPYSQRPLYFFDHAHLQPAGNRIIAKLFFEALFGYVDARLGGSYSEFIAKKTTEKVDNFEVGYFR